MANQATEYSINLDDSVEMAASNGAIPPYIRELCEMESEWQ